MAFFARQAPRGRAPAAVRGGIARDHRTVLFGGARRRRLAIRLSLGLLVAASLAGAVTVSLAPAREAPPSGSIGPSPPPPPDDGRGAVEPIYPVIEWRESRALGLPYHRGRLVRGVQLPAEGPDWFTWDPVLEQRDNRGYRRWGTAGVLRTTMSVLRRYRAADPEAPRVGIEDLSRRRGGPFGRKYGGLGHASHQNGLDVDVLYPRRDERERRASRSSLVDRERAQALVDLFVEAGAEKVFVGPSLGITGPRGVVIPLVHHDDHLHARIPRPPQ